MKQNQYFFLFYIFNEQVNGFKMSKKLILQNSSTTCISNNLGHCCIAYVVKKSI